MPELKGHFDQQVEKRRQQALKAQLNRYDAALARIKNPPVAADIGVTAMVKKNAAPPERPSKVEHYWKTFPSTCAQCRKTSDHVGKGYLFCGMTPEGEMKTFCNVECSDDWEKGKDNKNSRRAAIRAQKAKGRERKEDDERE